MNPVGALLIIVGSMLIIIGFKAKQDKLLSAFTGSDTTAKSLIGSSQSEVGVSGTVGGNTSGTTAPPAQGLIA